MFKLLACITGPLLPVSLAVAAVKVPINGNDLNSNSPRCEIRVSYHDGQVVLRGVVFSHAPLSGSYYMRVSKTSGSGSAELVQSGGFRVNDDESASLGLLSLSPGAYAARLKVQWDDGAAECSKHVRGKPLSSPKREI